MSCSVGRFAEARDRRAGVALRLRDARRDHGAGELQHVRRRDADDRQQAEIRRPLERRDRVGFGRRRGKVAPCGMRHAARVVPHRLDVGDAVARVRQREDRLRRAELGMGEIGRRLHRVHHRDSARDLVGDDGSQLFGRVDHRRPVARHLRRRHHEVDVVRIVAEPVDAHRRLRCRQIGSRRPPRLSCCRRARRGSGRRGNRCGSACARDVRRPARRRACGRRRARRAAAGRRLRPRGCSSGSRRHGPGLRAARARASARSRRSAAWAPCRPAASSPTGSGPSALRHGAPRCRYRPGIAPRPCPWRRRRPHRAGRGRPWVLRVARRERRDQRLLARCRLGGQRLRLRVAA